MVKYYLHLTFWAIVAAMAVLSYGAPDILGRGNQFLQNFVNHEFINFMGVIVTITLASTANIHIELRKKEDRAGEDFLRGTREKVRKSAYSLIWALLVAVAIVIFKPILAVNPETISIFNSLAVATILWGVFVIYDLTRLAFKM